VFYNSKLLMSSNGQWANFFRYYGASSHVNVSVTTPVEEFRWLTTAQALADIPVAQVVDLTNGFH